MDAKLDYLSFTLPLNLGGVGHGDEVESAIVAKMQGYGLGTLIDILATGGAPDRNKGRKIYGAGVHWKANNISIWWGGVANHVLCEISGVGCQMLRDHDTLLDTVGLMQERVTRLDVAVDFPGGCKPAEFVASKEENRFRVTQTNDEETGWTQYVGSRKSDRFARVYMYAAPHPRAGVLRVEHVLRARYAKLASSAIVTSTLAEQVAVLGNTFGWKHPAWKPEIMTDGKLKAQRHDKEDAATLRWLIKAVAPALAKAHASGLIDLDTFLTEHVYTRINS